MESYSSTGVPAPGQLARNSYNDSSRRSTLMAPCQPKNVNVAPTTQNAPICSVSPREP